jgi:hypothetical protein
MSTNYYLRQPACSQCGHSPAKLHIGKSSSGWNFGLRIYPKIGAEPDERLTLFGAVEICELEDWLPLFELFPIFDEYDEGVSSTDMRAIITDRSHPRGLASRLTAGFELMGPYHDPSTDTRAGKGTYDLCNYEFS